MKTISKITILGVLLGQICFANGLAVGFDTQGSDPSIGIYVKPHVKTAQGVAYLDASFNQETQATADEFCRVVTNGAKPKAFPVKHEDKGSAIGDITPRLIFIDAKGNAKVRTVDRQSIAGAAGAIAKGALGMGWGKFIQKLNCKN